MDNPCKDCIVYPKCVSSFKPVYSLENKLAMKSFYLDYNLKQLKILMHICTPLYSYMHYLLEIEINPKRYKIKISKELYHRLTNELKILKSPFDNILVMVEYTKVFSSYEKPM